MESKGVWLGVLKISFAKCFLKLYNCDSLKVCTRIFDFSVSFDFEYILFLFLIHFHFWFIYHTPPPCRCTENNGYSAAHKHQATLSCIKAFRHITHDCSTLHSDCARWIFPILRDVIHPSHNFCENNTTRAATNRTDGVPIPANMIWIDCVKGKVILTFYGNYFNVETNVQIKLIELKSTRKLRRETLHKFHLICYQLF